MSYQVAKDIMAYCTSCRRNLVHIIVAVDGEKIARVQCRSCKKEHAYHPPKGAAKSTSRKKAAKTPARKKPDAGPGKWEKVMEKHQGLPSRPYSMAGTFEIEDKLDHSTFGMGVVTKIIKPNKMEVLFRQGCKTLIWGKVD